MVDLQKIIGIAIKEFSPIIMNSFNTDQAAQRLEKAKLIEEEYYKRMKKLINTPTPVNDNTGSAQGETINDSISSHIHGDSGECTSCGRDAAQFKPMKNRRQAVSTGLPHATTGGKDPHYNYTVHELAKHLALIQNHFTDYKCSNCISKHLMIIEGLAEEGIPMTSDGEEKLKFQKVIEWTRAADKRKDYDKMLDESREVRLMLTGSEHGDDEPLITSYNII